MRCTKCLFSLCFFAAAAMPSLSQMPDCKGQYNIVRLSEIRPGKLATFLSAVEAQRSWYQKAGSSDEISLLRVVDTKSGTYSEAEALTLHRSTNKVPPRSHDAGYDAFVALYKDSSTLKSQYITCETK